MIRYGCLVVCLLMSFIASAQSELYTVSDPDGYVNIRSGPSSKTSIVDRVVPGEIIWIFPEEEAPGWFPVYFLADSFAVKPGMMLGNQVEASGYIHKSRLEPLFLQEVEFVTTSTDTSTTYSSDTVKLIITITANVDSPEGDAPFFLWGTDGGKPNKAYASISLELGDREIEFSHTDVWLCKSA